MYIELKQDEFLQIRNFISLILDQSKKPNLKKTVKQQLGISWDKLDAIKIDLIYSKTMDIQKKKELLKFLKKIVARMNDSEELERNVKKDYKITKKQIELSIEKLKKKKELSYD